jgi:hypothetical protein
MKSMFADSQYRGWTYPRSQLSILKVCRQITAEAKLLPFVLTEFAGYAENVLDMFTTTLTFEQANAISAIRLFVDAFAIYRYGVKVPDAGLKDWFTMELRQMGLLTNLKRMTLIWYDREVDRLREQLVQAVEKEFGSVNRADIKVVVDYWPGN